MELNILSPYIRLAMYSILPEKWTIGERVIYDYELIYVQSGECIIHTSGEDYVCNADKVVFLRPGIPHSFRVLEKGQFSQPHIHFDPVYSEKSRNTPVSFKNITSMSVKEKSLISPDIFSEINIPVIFEPIDPINFKKRFFELLNIYQHDPNDVLSHKILMLEIIRMIIDQFSNNNSDYLKNEFQKLAVVKEYIDANYMKIISLEDISAYFSCNKFTLLRNFKNRYGETIIAYYNRKRFETASHILSNTSLTVKEVSEMLNFTDEYTFSRYFKNKCGLSPSAYRKIKYSLDNL